MKNYIIFGIFGLLSLVSTGSSQSSPCPVKELFQKSWKLCIAEVSKENANLLMEDKNPDNEEIRCYKTCVLNHIGFFNEGRIDTLKLEAIMSEAKDQKAGKAIVEAVKNCKGIAEAGNNKCDVGAHYVDCIAAVKMF